jgi:hypothetical protein
MRKDSVEVARRAIGRNGRPEWHGLVVSEITIRHRQGQGQHRGDDLAR